MTDDTENPTLVVGGTGKTGRRVAERLTARGVPVRIGSRDSEPEVRTGRIGRVGRVVAGVESAYVTYDPDLVVPGAAATVGSFAELAVTSRVRQLVLLSARGEDGALLAEHAVRESGADWTILRSTWFSQNFSENYLLEPVLSSEVALPVDGVQRALGRRHPRTCRGIS